VKPKIPASSQEDFARKVIALWPALKGSLAEVRKPCIRPRCHACTRGDNHPAYLLSFTKGGRRRCMYVPARLVALIKRALKNGRRIETLLYQIGPALIREHRRSRAAMKTHKEHVRPTNSGGSKKKIRRES
jgi:Family of unknown function (DUF6788)